MTKRELLELLKDVPDDGEIRVSGFDTKYDAPYDAAVFDLVEVTPDVADTSNKYWLLDGNRY